MKILREQLCSYDGIEKHVGGIVIDSFYLSRNSVDFCKEEAEWCKNRNLRIIVDTTKQFNHYPDLSYANVGKKEYRNGVYENFEYSMKCYEDILQKMKLYGSNEIIIPVLPQLEGQKARNSWMTPEDSLPVFISGIREVCNRANEQNITVYLQNSKNRVIHLPNNKYKRFGDHETLAIFIDDLRKEGLNIGFALNTGFATKPGTDDPENLATLFNLCQNIPSIILLSTPDSTTRASVLLSIQKRSDIELSCIKDNESEFTLALDGPPLRDWNNIQDDLFCLGWD